MSRLKKTLLVATGVALSAWLYASPYFAVKAIANAAAEKDAVALAKYVDFPAVRESLKAGIRAQTADRLRRDAAENPLAIFGMVIAGGLADVVVDSMVTPESIGLLLKGDLPRSPANSSDSPAGTEPATPDDGTRPVVSQRYRSWDRFEIRSEDRRRPGRITTLTLTRHGLFDWKLSAIGLP